MKQMTETMQLVTFQDGDKYGEPITNSVVIAKVYGLRHDNVLQAIDNLVSGTEEVIGEEQLLNFQELFLDTGTCLSVNSDGEIVDGDWHLLKCNRCCSHVPISCQNNLNSM